MSRERSKASRSKEQVSAAQGEKNRMWVENSMFQFLTVVLAWIVYVRVVQGSNLPPAFLLSWWLLFVTRASLTWLAGRYRESRDPGSVARLRTVLGVRTVVSVMILALIAFPVLFYSALPAELAASLRSGLRATQAFAAGAARLAVVALSTLSGYLVNIVLSILGTALYDLGKSRLAQRGRQPGAAPTQSAPKQPGRKATRQAGTTGRSGRRRK